MKRKRGCGKRKPKMPPVVGAKEGIPNFVTLNTQDDYIPDHYDDAEYDARMETETVQNNNRNECRQQRANLSKKARSNTSKLSKGFTSSIKPSDKNKLEQGRRTRQKDPKVPHKDALYKDKELKAALDVIKKVMEMDAAEPFNAPVDPIALGIPDYFNVIDTPMDFGTICKNLENGVKYKNSKDVFGDVQYIWENCSKYNNKGHYILELMKRVKKNFTKYWTEAGLYREQPQEITGHSHVPPMESTKRYCTRGQKSTVGSMTDNPRHQQQDQMDLSQRQPHQPSQSYNIPCQSQQKSCQFHLSSGQQQTFHPETGRNVVSTGNSYLTPMEANVRRSPSEHGFPVGPNADDASSLRQNQTGLHQLQHQPSSSYSQPFQPYQGSSQCQPSFGQPQPSHAQAGTYISIAGHSHLPRMGSMVRRSPHGHRHPVGLMDEEDNPIHLQHNQTGVSKLQLHPHHPSLYCSQASQPQQGSISCQPNVGLLQPSQPHARTDLASAGLLCSPPPVESMIRCRKHGPTSLANTMTDYTSHEQRDQTAVSQMLTNLLSEINGELHQPEQGTCQVQKPSSCQPQPSQPSTHKDMGCADSISLRRTRGRGPTRCLDVWNMEGKISVATNELGQPVGSEAPKLSNFLGTIARNGHMAPLNYVDWRAVPDESKEKMWQQVQSKFDIDPISVSWVMKSIGRKWKDWKAELKASRYSTHETNEERLADLDERVLPDQWRILVSFWNSKEAKDRSVTNKANRAHQKICHATGTKSFARIREEQRAKMPDGKEPSRAELFILTRTRKDGRPVNEASSALISQLRERAAQRQNSPNGVIEDDVFVQVMGHDRHGRVRTYGLGPSPSDFGGLKPSRAEAIKMVSEANAEVRGMKDRMVAVEQTCAQMAAQMATMMSMMSNMQNKSFDKHGLPSEPSHARRVANVSSNSGESPQLQAHPASYVQEVSSHQRRAVKRGKVQSASSSRVLRKRN